MLFRSVGLALIALWMVSCQDLLTEDPKGQLAVTNFFNSKADLDLALNGMYSKVASDMYANIWAGFESVMGDDISTHPAANKQGLREVDTYNVSDNNTWVTELWGARWRLVKAANFIIGSFCQIIIRHGCLIDIPVCNNRSIGTITYLIQ